MKKFLLKKEDLIAEMRPKYEKELDAQMRAAGIKFKLLDLEWTSDGIVIHYDESILSTKAKGK